MINNTVLSSVYISTWTMLLFAFVFVSGGLLILTQMGLPIAFGQTIGNETAGGNAVGGSQGLNVTHGGGPGAGATNQSTSTTNQSTK
jgi:hypothetical protein